MSDQYYGPTDAQLIERQRDQIVRQLEHIAKLEAEVDRLVNRGIENIMQHRITKLEAERDGYAQNAAFFKLCALSGEWPKAGSEPYSPPVDTGSEG